MKPLESSPPTFVERIHTQILSQIIPVFIITCVGFTMVIFVTQFLYGILVVPVIPLFLLASQSDSLSCKYTFVTLFTLVQRNIYQT
jgi:hypothetical protein